MRERNLARRAFLGPDRHGRLLYGVSDHQNFARHCAQRLRATAARYPDDLAVTSLIRELQAGSELFRELWASHDVTDESVLRKTFRHPVVGPITVNCDVLDITDRDQRVVIYTAVPGSADEQALRLLSVVGTQRLDVAG